MRRLRLTGVILTAATPSLLSAQSVSDSDRETSHQLIVVFGQRAIIGALSDTAVEQTYDQNRVAAYGADSIGEVIDEIATENGDEAPALLVNGEPVASRDDIADYPAQAIRRVEVLPRGAASRIGGAGGQRAYNIVLRPSVSSLTAAAAYRAASAGHWHSQDDDLALTYIRGPNRVNLTLQAYSSGLLRESDRGVIQPDQTVPYDPIGNLLPSPAFGRELDPQLSALAGELVTAAGVPSGLAQPGLADFAARANQPNTTDLGRYRSLRAASQRYAAGIAGSLRLTKWLTLSTTGKVDWNRDNGLSGLPQGLFVVTADNAFSPFSRDVLLARSDADRPLQSRSQVSSASGSAMLNARIGHWNARLTGRLSRQERNYSYAFGDQSAGPVPLAPQQNPFVPEVGALIPVGVDRTRSRSAGEGLQADIDGPVMPLPAGAVRVRSSAALSWTRLIPQQGAIVAAPYARHDVSLQAGITIPLSSRVRRVLHGLGDIELVADVARTDLSRGGRLTRQSFGLNWQFRRWLRFNASSARDQRPPEVDLLAAPVIYYPLVRIYDPLRDTTVDVTSIGGGNPALLPETLRTTRLSLGAAPLPRINLQLQAQYTAIRSANQVGTIPAASSPAILAAFPDRFRRDAAGQLSLVDTRAINFTARNEQQFRYSMSFTLPLYRVRSSAEMMAQGAGAGPRPRLDVNLAHTIQLANRVTVRPGLPDIDLLAGGAIGIGTGLSRHQVSGSIALTDRGSGLRLNGSWRSASGRMVGPLAAPEQLHFSPLATFDLRSFVEAPRLLPKAGWAKGGRITLAVQNLTNARQRVRDSNGATPLIFQPAYLDAVGRTVMIQLRKVF